MFQSYICVFSGVNEETQERINCLPATLLDEKICGVKWVSVFPPNPGRFGVQNLSAIIVLSEIEGNIYGGMGPLYVIGSGNASLTANIFYIAFMNVGDTNSFISGDLQWFKEMLDYSVEQNCGEQISLSNFLSLAAQAQNYEDQYGWD